MNVTKLSLLLVVFVDVLGQGLIFPIMNTLLIDPSIGFLPAGSSAADRELVYGIVIGAFFLAWFLGAAYISKLSDMIGRKTAIQICLFGALFGYFLTILAIYVGSLWLLILGRAVTGFTAGNQPIAQAAMADLSRDDVEKARNMGFIVASFSLSLIAGPLLAGLLTDRDLLGDAASLQLPFYAAAALIVLVIVMIAVFFRDARQERKPLRIQPAEIFLLLWRISQRPTVLRLSLPFFFFMFASNSFVLFIDNFLTARFGFGTFGNSMAIMVFGATLAATSAFLVGWIGTRFARGSVVALGALGYLLSAALFAFASSPWTAFAAIVAYAFCFAVAYPTFLAIFSASVDETEQGWVMGVTTALFTLGAGITAILGGELMGIAIRMPFYLAIAGGAITLLLMQFLWRGATMHAIVRRTAGAARGAPA